jgi:hypothetical protein
MTELQSKLFKKINVKKSQLIENLLNFQGSPISFNDYLISKEIIDLNPRKMILLGGRQISKSFTVSVNNLAKCMIQKYYYILYISPTLDQTRTFSNEKIRARINESEKFKKWFIDKNSIQNVFEKDFTNGSKIYFRAATQGDTLRGISTDEVNFDEIQDIPSDIVPIALEVMSGKRDTPEKKTGFITYTGTAKTIYNYSTVLWNKSSKISPILLCPDCRYHNVPSEENIHEDYLRCKRCKGRLSVRPPHLILLPLGDKDAELTGFWIPQIVLPLHVEDPIKWKQLYIKLKEYPKEKFLNEIMGIPAGSGSTMITEDDLKACCYPEFEMWDSYKDVRGMAGGKFPIYAGIDWAITNQEGKSFTVFSVGRYNTFTKRFTIVFIKKFTDPDNTKILKEIAKLCHTFWVQKIVADHGAGVLANQFLYQFTGIPLVQVMYTGDRKVIDWDAQAKYYKASRTKTLLELFDAIKTRRIHFFSWKTLSEIKSHFLAEFAETKFDRYGNDVLRFDHPPDEPDDALHSINIMYAVFKKECSTLIKF